jgi:hypothetical protein
MRSLTRPLYAQPKTFARLSHELRPLDITTVLRPAGASSRVSLNKTPFPAILDKAYFTSKAVYQVLTGEEQPTRTPSQSSLRA